MNHFVFAICMYVRTFLTLHPSVMGDDSLQKGGDLMDVIVYVLVKILCGRDMIRNQRRAVCTCCHQRLPHTYANVHTYYIQIVCAHVNMLESN